MMKDKGYEIFGVSESFIVEGDSFHVINTPTLKNVFDSRGVEYKDLTLSTSDIVKSLKAANTVKQAMEVSHNEPGLSLS